MSVQISTEPRESKPFSRKGTRERADANFVPTRHCQLSPTGAARVETRMAVTAMTDLLTHTIRRHRLDALHDVFSVSADVASSSSNG